MEVEGGRSGVRSTFESGTGSRAPRRPTPSEAGEGALAGAAGGRGPAEDVQAPPGGGRGAARGRPGRDCRAARAPTGRGRPRPSTWWSGWSRPDAGRVWIDERRPHHAAHAPAGPRGPGLPAAGAVHLPASSPCARTSSRCWSCRRGWTGRRARPAPGLLEEFGLATVAESPGRDALGRRAAARGDRPVADPQPPLHALRRALRRRGPHQRGDLQRQICPLKERGLGVLITDHNVQDTLRICDRAYIIAQGQILEEGTPRSARRLRARADALPRRALPPARLISVRSGRRENRAVFEMCDTRASDLRAR